MKPLRPTSCDLMVHKHYKIDLKLVFPTCRSTSGFTTSPVLLSIIMSPSITIFFRSPSHANFLIESSISFWSYTCRSMACCFWSSARHAIQVGVSELKIIFLHLVTVSLMASSISSFVFIQFWRGIFNFFASSNSDVLFIYY